MLIKASMVPLPITAGGKFREAIYFFNRMVQTRTNVYVFPFHFSAFLSALRSVTFYLQAQFSENSAFKSWYQAKQDQMRDDPLLRMLKAMRDEVLHSSFSSGMGRRYPKVELKQRISSLASRP